MKTLTLITVLLITGLASSAQSNKANVMKLLQFFSKEAPLDKDAVKNGTSSLFSIKVRVDRKGKVQNVSFSETVPDSLRPKLLKLSDGDIDWLAFVNSPKETNDILIPVFRIVDRNPNKGIDFNRKADEFGIRDYFSGIFKFDSKLSSSDVVVIDPVIVAVSDSQIIEKHLYNEDDLKRADVSGKTTKLVNPIKEITPRK